MCPRSYDAVHAASLFVTESAQFKAVFGLPIDPCGDRASILPPVRECIDRLSGCVLDVLDTRSPGCAVRMGSRAA